MKVRTIQNSDLAIYFKVQKFEFKWLNDNEKKKIINTLFKKRLFYDENNSIMRLILKSKNF